MRRRFLQISRRCLVPAVPCSALSAPASVLSLSHHDSQAFRDGQRLTRLLPFNRQFDARIRAELQLTSWSPATESPRVARQGPALPPSSLHILSFFRRVVVPHLYAFAEWIAQPYLQAPHVAALPAYLQPHVVVTVTFIIVFGAHHGLRIDVCVPGEAVRAI